MANFVIEIIDIFYWSFFGCFLFSLILHLLFIVHMCFTYRSHMRKLLKGDIKWHFKNTSSPADLMVYGMRYSGYQIAYMFYGYFLIAFILLLICLVITYLIIIPLRDDFYSPLVQLVKKLWPTIILGFALYYGQVILAKFCFLQDRGAYMALDNRRFYHITSFYLFFFNVVLGIFSCLRRLLLSVVFGLVLISRLDRCLLMRGFERFDTGFKAYLGMLEVELYHTHPLLRAFVLILQEQVHDTKATSRDGEMKETRMNIDPGFANGQMKELKTIDKKTYDKRIVIKWWKMVTLVHNPSLIIERINLKLQKEGKKKSEVVDGIINAAGTVGAGFTASTVMAVGKGASDAFENISTAL